MDGIHTIKAISARTGISVHTIRAWERRYGAVAPARSASNRRFYTDAELHRLQLLNAVVESGHTISAVARLTDEDLEALSARGTTGVVISPLAGISPEALVDLAFEAVAASSVHGVSRAVDHAARGLPASAFITGFAAPLLQRVGAAWRRGEVAPAHERLATGAIRSALGQMLERGRPAVGPWIVLGSLAGDQHELGALMVAVTAQAEGWRSAYLGSGLPGADLGRAAREVGARMVGVSITCIPDVDAASRELLDLRATVGDQVTIVLGGAESGRLADVAEQVSAELSPDLAAARAALRSQCA
ncbi:MAG: MerR family transcriptional regulator [Armatimonadetes bacterium]|nr:MerR family transcriptional regulator [Armatimonadota bacterium]